MSPPNSTTNNNSTNNTNNKLFVPFCLLLSFCVFSICGFGLLVHLLEPEFGGWIKLMLGVMTVDVLFQMVMLYYIKKNMQLATTLINLFHACTVFASLYVAVPCAWSAFAVGSIK